MPTPLTIDLVSDFVCPWCLVGKTRLARAIEQVRATRPDVDVRINWLPFFLNPDTPPAGEPYRAFLEAKFGGPLEADRVQASVAEAGAEDGVKFAFERIQVRPNTLKAHRLTYRAQAVGHRPARVQAQADALFAAHFQEGRDIGNDEVLADIAAATTGENRDAVLAYLAGDEDAAAVKRMAEQVQRQGVSGVPFFIFNRKLVASGAQSPAILGAAMLQALG